MEDGEEEAPKLERKNAMRMNVMPDEELFMPTPERAASEKPDIVEISSDGSSAPEEDEEAEDDEEQDSDEEADTLTESSGEQNSDDGKSDVSGLFPSDEEADEVKHPEGQVEEQSDYDSGGEKDYPEEEDEEDDLPQYTDEPALKRSRTEEKDVPAVMEVKKPLADVMKGVVNTQLWRVSQDWMMPAPFGLEPNLDKKAVSAAAKAEGASGKPWTIADVAIDTQKPYHKGWYSICDFLLNGGESGRIASYGGPWKHAVYALAKRIWEVLTNAEELNKAKGMSFLQRSNEKMRNLTVNEQPTFIRALAKSVCNEVMTKFMYATTWGIMALGPLEGKAPKWGDGIILRTMEALGNKTAESALSDQIDSDMWKMQTVRHYVRRVSAVTRFLYSTLTTGSAPGDLQHGIGEEDEDTVMLPTLLYKTPSWVHYLEWSGDVRVPRMRSASDGNTLEKWKPASATGENPRVQLLQRASVGAVITERKKIEEDE